MTIHYGAEGPERKRLVSCIEKALGVKSKYLGPPSFAYRVGEITIARDGAVSGPDALVSRVLPPLEAEGFKNPEAQEEAPAATGGNHLTITVPREKVKVAHLLAIISSKDALIRKAIGAESLPIEVHADTVSFPWFPLDASADEMAAYTHFVEGLCRMSREQKRITAREREVENEKYAFRCFLLRLGFIGDEYKKDRKILLRNFTGSSAYKSGRREEASDADSGQD